MSLITELQAAQRESAERAVIRDLEWRGLVSKTSTHILLVRNPGGGGIVAISDDDEITQFKTEVQAHQCAMTQVLCQAWGYQVVEVD